MIIKLVEYAYSKDIRLILTMEDYDYVTKEIRNPSQRLLNHDNYKMNFPSVMLSNVCLLTKMWRNL